MSYLEGHKKSGLKVGDKVIIIKKAKDYERGWDNIWVNGMNEYISKSGYISHDGGILGFEISSENIKNYCFPYFVLSSRKDKIKKILE